MVGKVIETLHEFQMLGRECNGLFIDGGGLGAGVVDQLRHLGYNPIDINFGHKSPDETYRYHGDLMWAKLRDALATLYLPEDRDFLEQLTQREFAFGLSGKIHLEPKADLKKRGCVSPDIADALALTYAQDIQYNPSGADVNKAKPQFTNHDWDPIAYKVDPPRRRKTY